VKKILGIDSPDSPEITVPEVEEEKHQIQNDLK